MNFVCLFLVSARNPFTSLGARSSLEACMGGAGVCPSQSLILQCKRDWAWAQVAANLIKVTEYWCLLFKCWLNLLHLLHKTAKFEHCQSKKLVTG